MGLPADRDSVPSPVVASRAAAWERYWREAYRPGRERPGGFTRWAVRALRDAGAREVVDLGCGPGRDMSFLLEQGFAVTGVDVSPFAIEVAEAALRRLTPGSSSRARLVRSDLLEFLRRTPSNSVDAVHASATYQGLAPEEFEVTLQEIGRVLVPGGVHVWSIRTDRHVGRAQSEHVPPNLPGLGATVPVRFPSRDELARTVVEPLRRLTLEEVEVSRGRFSVYVVDRKSSERA